MIEFVDFNETYQPNAGKENAPSAPAVVAAKLLLLRLLLKKQLLRFLLRMKLQKPLKQ
jgi:hypothetical protein